MISIKLSKTCLECPHIDIATDTNQIYYDNKPYVVSGYISCAHEEVCKDYDSDFSITNLLASQK